MNANKKLQSLISPNMRRMSSWDIKCTLPWLREANTLASPRGPSMPAHNTTKPFSSTILAFPKAFLVFLFFLLLLRQEFSSLSFRWLAALFLPLTMSLPGLRDSWYGEGQGSRRAGRWTCFFPRRSEKRSCGSWQSKGRNEYSGSAFLFFSL